MTEETFPFETYIDMGAIGLQLVSIVGTARHSPTSVTGIETDIKSAVVHVLDANLNRVEASILPRLKDFALLDIHEQIEKRYLAFKEREKTEAVFDFDDHGGAA